MKTFAQFKQEEGITSIELMKAANGRKFAQVNEKNIIVATNCDLSKPLFVVPTSNKDTKEVVPNLFTIVNSTVEMAETI